MGRMVVGGVMSWSVAFAFAVVALGTGKLGNEWVRVSRRYGMVAWVILGLGNVLGAWWAYHVLGWGGYWGWDPVENVALMPWLVGTAFIHSIQMQERRGMLKAWNILLIMGAFFLSIFGTVVVRSGILGSVHASALSASGALLPWRGATREQLRNNFVIPVAGTVLGLAILLILGVRDPFAGIGFGLCLFVLGTILQEFVRGAMARHRATGENYLAALGNLIRRNNRRYGGATVYPAPPLRCVWGSSAERLPPTH